MHFMIRDSDSASSRLPIVSHHPSQTSEFRTERVSVTVTSHESRAFTIWVVRGSESHTGVTLRREHTSFLSRECWSLCSVCVYVASISTASNREQRAIVDMSTTASVQELTSRLETKKHISFLLRCLRMLPQPYTSADDQRMTLGYFAISGLDLLNATNKIPTEEKVELIDWVYAQQLPTGGFRGSPSTTSPCSSSTTSASGGANIAMTYAALLVLAILRDDFARLDREPLKRFISSLQHRDGGFAAEQAVVGGIVDRDPRFTYCAVAICSMLGEAEEGVMDLEALQSFLQRCQRYDGGFGASESHEAHAGMTYCCVAALHLLARNGPEWERKNEAVSWLVHRQVAPTLEQAATKTAPSRVTPPDSESESSDQEQEREQDHLTGGFQGRPAKLPPDVCYSFWNGACLSLLEQHDLIDSFADATYVLSAQSRVGGIAKIPDDHPDLLHTYLGLASLSLHQAASTEAKSGGAGEAGASIDFGLKPLDAAYNCSMTTKEWIRTQLTK